MAGKEEICPGIFEDFVLGTNWFSLTFEDLTTLNGAWKELEPEWAGFEELLIVSVIQVKGILDVMMKMG